MSNNNQRLEGINWSLAFPHVSIFRSFKMAIHPSKLLLGTSAVVAIWLYGSILDGFFRLFGCGPYFVPGMKAIADSISYLIGAAIGLQIVAGNGSPGVLHSLADLLQQVQGLFVTNWIFGVLLYAGMLVICGLTLGALARIAALQSAKDEKISMGEALSFARRKFVSFLAAPAIPVIIVVGIGIALVLGAFLLGWLLSWIWLGHLVTGLLMGAALLGGLIASITLIATTAGLPLMYPTIAVEGSDAFDAVSRSYSYVFSRPWQAALAGLVALIYGGLCFLFLKLVLFVTLLVTHGFVNSGWPALDAVWVKPQWSELWVIPANWADLNTVQSVGYFLIWVWVHLFVAVLLGWVLSFYVCASTQVYYLLRKEVDATELDDVFVEEYEEEELAPASDAPSTTETVQVTVAVQTSETSTPAAEPPKPETSSGNVEPPPTNP